MFDSILVPLDGSKRAEAILAHIESLCRLAKSRVILLKVLEDLQVWGIGEAVDLHHYNEKRERLTVESETYLTRIKSLLDEKKILAVSRIAHGPVVRTIIETAAEEDVDLIAMASHGRGGLSRTFYGSVAAGILQRVDRPLLLIRARK